MSEAVTLHIIGELKGITEKPNGWHEVEVLGTGQQYTKKLATKKDEIVALARAVGIGNVGTFTYKESDGNENPNRPGTFYKNRYLEDAEPGASAEAQAAVAAQAPTASGSSDVPKEVWEAKERRDFRSRAWAQAITASAHTARSDETPQQIYERVHPLARLIFVDVVRNLTDQEAEDDPEIPF